MEKYRTENPSPENKLPVNGKIYNEVIGTHAKSILKIDLHGDATRLRSQIGVADSKVDISDKSLAVLPLVNGTGRHQWQNRQRFRLLYRERRRQRALQQRHLARQ